MSNRPDYICPDCGAEMNREFEDDHEFFWCNNCQKSHEVDPVPAAKLAIMQDMKRIKELEQERDKLLRSEDKYHRANEILLETLRRIRDENSATQGYSFTHVEMARVAILRAHNEALAEPVTADGDGVR